jgi:diacylglycerol kinase family enzyme
VRIEAAAPVLFHVDGEPCVGEGPLDVTVHPRSLVVRVPSA